MMKKKVLIVVTNVNTMGKDHPTGLWLEEFAVPYLALLEAGYEVTVASPRGGKTPLDPNSVQSGILPQWQAAAKRLEATEVLSALDRNAYAGVILPGGHGPMFDLASDETLASLLTEFMEQNKLVAAVCHGPAALVKACFADGSSILAGRRVTGFSNDEEYAVQLEKLVPFLLEDKLQALGAVYSRQDLWQEYVVTDGNLITGQNPQSSPLFATAVVDYLDNV